MANKIVLFIIFSALLVTTVFMSGCTEITGKVAEMTCEGNCRGNRDSCNDRCGSGILNSICKEGCTLNYNDCLRHC